MPSGPLDPFARPSHWAGGIAVSGLLTLLALAYLPSFSIPFFFDDRDAITHNPTIRDLSNLTAILSPPKNGGGATGRPLVNLSLALNYAWSGNEVTSYHAFNLLLHAFATLALLGVIRRTLAWSPAAAHLRNQGDTTAFLAAGMWSLHPLQTESVSCIIQRTEILGGLFLLVTLYAFIRSARDPQAWRWKVGAVAASAAGMASKEIMVCAPVLVFFYDRTFVAGTFREAWRQRRGLHLAIAATWLVLLANLISIGGSRGTAAGFGLGTPWWAYSLKQFEAITTYLRLAAWPSWLTIDYGDALVFDPAEVWMPALFVVALMFAIAWKLFRPAPAGYLGLWFFAILAPSSSVVPLVTQTIAEHRMYLPLAAIVTLLTGLAATALPMRPVRLVGVGVLVALTVSTFARNRVLGDELALWQDTVAKAPRNARAYDNLARALLQRGRAAEALAAYHRALELNPRSGITHGMLADAYLGLGRLSEAEDHYRLALELAPTQSGIANNFGLVRLRSGDPRAAADLFRHELRHHPHSLEAHRNLALALAAVGDLAAARHQLEAGLRLDPGYAPLEASYGDILAQAGLLEEALVHFERALALDPLNAVTHNNAAHALIRLQRPAAALGHSARAVALQPDLPQAQHNHGLALALQGDLGAAATHLERALALQPDYHEARENLARIRAARADGAAAPRD